MPHSTNEASDLLRIEILGTLKCWGRARAAPGRRAVGDQRCTPMARETVTGKRWYGPALGRIPLEAKVARSTFHALP